MWPVISSFIFTFQFKSTGKSTGQLCVPVVAHTFLRLLLQAQSKIQTLGLFADAFFSLCAQQSMTSLLGYMAFLLVHCQRYLLVCPMSGNFISCLYAAKQYYLHGACTLLSNNPQLFVIEEKGEGEERERRGKGKFCFLGVWLYVLSTG